MLKALSSTEKSERDDQARNATPRMPSAVAFSRIARTARSSESSDVLGKARCSSRMKNEPEFAWPAVLRTASERKSSGTNESSAKYAIIAARCVPRSAKNLRAIARIKQQYAPPHGCSPGPRRPDRDLVAGRSRRDRRRGGHGARDDDRRRRPRGTLRPGCGDDARGGREPPPDAGLPGLSQLEAATLEGSVFVVRRESDSGPRIIAATTRPDPTVGLVFYDLKHCLRSIETATPANGTPRRTRKKAG